MSKTNRGWEKARRWQGESSPLHTAMPACLQRLLRGQQSPVCSTGTRAKHGCSSDPGRARGKQQEVQYYTEMKWMRKMGGNKEPSGCFRKRDAAQVGISVQHHAVMGGWASLKIFLVTKSFEDDAVLCRFALGHCNGNISLLAQG